jgi:hypothetical protein
VASVSPLLNHLHNKKHPVGISTKEDAMRKLATAAAAATILIGFTALADAQMDRTSRGMHSMSHGMSGKMMAHKSMKMNRGMAGNKMHGNQMGKKTM